MQAIDCPCGHHRQAADLEMDRTDGQAPPRDGYDVAVAS